MIPRIFRSGRGRLLASRRRRCQPANRRMRHTEGAPNIC